MKPISKPNTVPQGFSRRVALIMETACFACVARVVITAIGLTDCDKELRRRKWGKRKGRWHCPMCMGRSQTPDTPDRFRIGVANNQEGGGR